MTLALHYLKVKLFLVAVQHCIVEISQPICLSNSVIGKDPQ